MTTTGRRKEGSSRFLPPPSLFLVPTCGCLEVSVCVCVRVCVGRPCGKNIDAAVVAAAAGAGATRQDYQRGREILAKLWQGTESERASEAVAVVACITYLGI